METAIKISALAIIGVITVILLRKSLPEMSVVAILAIQAVLGICACGVLSTVLSHVRTFAENAGVGEALLKPLFRSVGISVIIKLASDICRDNGASAIASTVELIGGAIALSYSIPLMQMLLDGMFT